ncbi:MAG: glycosyltransferase [Euryarchaeota archaeon]|nr:glycosyltransferase [Euryarchaeota archaeon]
MAPGLHVSVVLPSLNEEASIARCIEGLRSALPDAELLVVDSSTDGTPRIARERGAAVLQPGGPGYGRACREGLQAARGELLLLGDADGTYEFREAPRLLGLLERGEADLVLGNRFRGGLQPGAMPFLHRHLGNPFLSWVCRRATGLTLGDVHCGLRAIRRDALRGMRLECDGFEFATEMVLEAARLGLRVAEVPVSYRSRPGGVSKIRSFRDGWRHLRLMAGYRRRGSPG